MSDIPPAKQAKVAEEDTASAAGGDDPLKLAPLFSGGDAWEPLLKPIIEAQPNAAEFIGPSRPAHIVPVRELTFQALKPNEPGAWKVCVFGQNPYPRVESATGVAMFDNSFGNWEDKSFGRVTSIRCIIKAAAMLKYKIPKSTSVKDIRQLLKSNNTVQPPEWFQAILAQGCLLLNASMTASTTSAPPGAATSAAHARFWKPIIHEVVEQILRAKAKDGSGIVFAWWGSQAKALKKFVSSALEKYPSVKVAHVDHYNPAAMGDAFCNGLHFDDINKALASVGEEPLDWLPSVGWDKGAKAADVASASLKMGQFMSQTMDLHKMYLERLENVSGEKAQELSAIHGIMDLPVVDLGSATLALVSVIPSMAALVERCVSFARKTKRAANISLDEVAALHLYTLGSAFYRKLNEALRDPSRTTIHLYFGYLRLFFSAVSKLNAHGGSLWRGVRLDLKRQYPKGSVITWWGVSSCTTRRTVAQNFMGCSGKRTLFEVRPKRAKSIQAFSAFTGEAELILSPGTQLHVAAVKSDAGGLCTITLEERDDPDPPLIS